MPETKITNEQIATEVMGWYAPAIDFLTDHNAAMLVVEKLRETGFVLEVDEPPYGNAYHVEFYILCDDNIDKYEATNKSLCVAICEAALKAVRS